MAPRTIWKSMVPSTAKSAVAASSSMSVKPRRGRRARSVRRA
jgi:hypothetical protein